MKRSLFPDSNRILLRGRGIAASIQQSFIVMLTACLMLTNVSAQQSTVDTTRRFIPAPIGTITPTRQTPVHDPVMIKEKDTYYLFCTGNGISVFSSKDMQNWRKEKPVFSRTPEWVVSAIPRY